MITATNPAHMALLEMRLGKIGNDLINVRSTVKALIAAGNSSGEISTDEMADVLQIAERLLEELYEAVDTTSLFREAASEQEQEELDRRSEIES